MEQETDQLGNSEQLPPTDQRDQDLWAYDDEFLRDLFAQVAQSHPRVRLQTWPVAIRLFWREKRSRQELAAELNLDPETVKSLIRLIRRYARGLAPSIETPAKPQQPAPEIDTTNTNPSYWEDILTKYGLSMDRVETSSAVQVSLKYLERPGHRQSTKPGAHTQAHKRLCRPAHVIGKRDMELAIGGSQSAKCFIEEYHQSDLQYHLRLVTDAKADPMGESCIFPFGRDQRTNSKRARGRPGKKKFVANTVRSLGRPRKQATEIPSSKLPTAIPASMPDRAA